MADLGYAKEDLARAGDRAVAAGRMTPSAVGDLVELFADKVAYVNGRALLDGSSLDTAVDKLIESRPHWKPTPIGAEWDMNNLSDRARAMAELRPDEFKALLAAWGFSGPGDTRRGKRPTEKVNGKDKAPDASNPFTRAGWNVTRQGALVKLDPAMAARLAASAHVKLGATRPVM